MREEEERKIALVTGAGRGIGKAIALLLSEDGHHVICVSRSKESCGATASEIQSNGGSAEALAVDVADSSAVELACLLYTSPSPRDYAASRMPSSA